MTVSPAIGRVGGVSVRLLAVVDGPHLLAGAVATIPLARTIAVTATTTDETVIVPAVLTTVTGR